MKRIVSGTILVLLLVCTPTMAFNIQPVKAERPRDGKVGTTMLPPPMDEGASRESSKYPSLVELKDEKKPLQTLGCHLKIGIFKSSKF